MRRALIIFGGVLVIVLGLVVSADASTPPPQPRTVTVAVMVDSHLGDTKAIIDCGVFGWHQSGPEGDGTLMLANVYAPAKVRCTITLR